MSSSSDLMSNGTFHLSLLGRPIDESSGDVAINFQNPMGGAADASRDPFMLRVSGFKAPWTWVSQDRNKARLMIADQTIHIVWDEFAKLETPYLFPENKSNWMYLGKWQGASCGLVAVGSGSFIHSWAELAERDILSVAFPWVADSPAMAKPLKKWQFYGASYVKGIWQPATDGLYSLSCNGKPGLDLALSLVFTRIAYPLLALELKSLPEKNKALWKRLCQNLGVLCGKAPRPSCPKESLCLSWEGMPISMRKNLLMQVNSQGSIMPERLWRFLIEGS